MLGDVATVAKQGQNRVKTRGGGRAQKGVPIFRCAPMSPVPRGRGQQGALEGRQVSLSLISLSAPAIALLAFPSFNIHTSPYGGEG